MNKRTLQEIFDAVIEGGFYANKDHYYNYMCNSLARARKYGVINTEEECRAIKSISTYITKLGYSLDSHTLAGALNAFGITESALASKVMPTLLAIYRDWTNRPYRSKSTRNSRRRELYAIQKAAKESKPC